MDIDAVLKQLKNKRPIFHSEADFQFALAWELQQQYLDASLRLEYPSPGDPQKHIDILVRLGNDVYPIELKYKKAKFRAVVNGEQYSLTDHSAQDLGKYDFVKDICRIEAFREHISGHREGYAIFLTNDPSYWNSPRKAIAGDAAFSVHHGAVKEGTMFWGPSMNEGSIKGREAPLVLSGSYRIDWHDYSRVDDTKKSVFMYAVVRVDAPKLRTGCDAKMDG